LVAGDSFRSLFQDFEKALLLYFNWFFQAEAFAAATCVINVRVVEFKRVVEPFTNEVNI
jgi:hypothetical protein